MKDFRSVLATAMTGSMLLIPLIGSASLGASPAPSGAATDELSTPPFPDTQAIFAPTRPPIDLTVTLDPGAAVSAVIPVEGGDLEASGADGTVYHLSIPDDALVEATEIQMTPVVSLDGLPTGGIVSYAVQLAPDGLQLFDFATLTITPSAELPIEEQLPFGYDGDGKGLFIATPVVDEPAIQLLIQHFSGYGVNRGLLADIEPERERLGGSEERRLQSQVAEALVRERQRQGGEGDTDIAGLFGPAFAEYERTVVEPRVRAAGESCAKGRLALETVLGLERQKQLIGMSDGSAFPVDLMSTAAHVCMQEEYELCVDEHIVHRMIPVTLGFERQRQLLGIEDPAAKAFEEDLAVRCLTFELVLESEAELKEQGFRATSNMESRTTLRYEPAELAIRGSSALTNTDFEVKVPKCGATPHPSDSTVDVMSLTWVTAPRGAGDQLGAITDYTLTWLPNPTAESATIACPLMKKFELTLGLWSLLFPILHQDEFQAAAAAPRAFAFLQGGAGPFQLPDLQPIENPGPFRTTGWTVAEDELLAEKEWSKSGRGGKISEEGSFELHHTPE
jgi:hypothetical protein